MKSILVITHDTSLSGAPKSLLLILKELKLKGYEITTIAIKGSGALERDFIKVSINYYNLENYNTQKIYNISNRLNRLLYKIPILSEKEKLLNLINDKKFDCIYANTINSIDLVIKSFLINDTPIVLHVHELKTVIDEFRPDLTKIDPYISHYIVPSFLNKDTLVTHFTISPTKISVIRETTVIPECKIEKTENVQKVIMCGGAYWRKGDDLFIQVASEVIKKLPNTHFYWVGYFSKERFRVNTADIEKLNLSKNIHLIQETTTPEVWLYQSDLFLLTSREDPFPLAAMEAGMTGLPIICFEKATGISEVIDQKMVVPYLNVAEMAKKTIEILNNKDHASALGQQNKKVFSKLNPENIALEIDNVIKKIKLD